MSNQFNVAKSTNFLFTISSKPEVSLKVQSTSLGALNLGSAPFATTRADLNIPDNKLIFDPLTIRFVVSEDFTEWFEMVKWINSVATSNDAHLALSESAELTILNSQNQPVMRVTYKGVIPLTLGDLQYSIADEEATLSCDVIVSIDSYDVENIVTGEFVRYGNEERY